jgi:ribulose-5-phosphate 4-epimerase/fuculose-1-phosphate aldolase
MATQLKLAAEGNGDVKGQVSAEEWAIRVDLAAAYRLVALYGWDDIIFTHLSARIPGPEHHFLINPYNLMFEEITASSLVKIDVHGNPVMETPYMTNPAGFTIHSAIHMARDDAQAVMHVHTTAGQAVAAQAEGLLPITQTALAVCHDLCYHEYEGIVRNHGTLSVGKSVAECFVRLYFLERACAAQVAALSAGPAGLYNPPQGTPEKVAGQTRGIGMLADMLAWPALLRKLDRIDSSFRD